MKNIFKAIFRHKIISAIIIILIVAGSYFGYKTLKNKGKGIQYVLAAVTKDTLIVSVSGSGQVTALDQIDIKSKVSGDILSVAVTDGQKVQKGNLLVQIDDSDAQETVQDDEKSYQQAKLDLEKLQGITNDLGTIQGIQEKAVNNLEKSYEDGFNDVSNVFLDLPNIMSGFNDVLFSLTINPSQWNIDYYGDAVQNYDVKILDYKTDAYNKYQNARTLYAKNFTDYKSINRSSDQAVIDSLINETYDTIKNISEAVKSTNNLIQFYQDTLATHNIKPQTISNTHLSTLNTYTGKTNSFISTLLSDKNTIQSNKEVLAETKYTIADQEDKVATAEKTLNDAKEKLEDYKIYASFNGVVAEANIKKGDSISSGTTIATLISEQQVGEISLSEVDVANVKIGQKAIISFDALTDFTISGKVINIDTVGTVSQGVVSYGVKIAFDTQDEKIKSGMSITADIITDAKQDVLILPSTAIKTQGTSKYVELVTASDALKQQLASNNSGITLQTPPTQQSIVTGISNDTSTEIVSGLKEGDIVVTSTVSSSTSSNSSTTKSNQTQIRIPGVGGFEGGR